MRQYFAETFSGLTSDPLPFDSSKSAINHFHSRYGVNLLAVKRVGPTPALVFSA